MSESPLSLSLLVDLEAGILRSMNQCVEPWLRRGLLSHALAPMGIVVVEVRGRRSARTLRVPLLALRVRDYLIATTVRRRRSQWVRNLESWGEGTVWVGGRGYTFRAQVFRDDSHDVSAARELPGDVQMMVSALQRLWLPGLAVAVLRVERGESTDSGWVGWLGGLATALARRRADPVSAGALP